MCSFSSCNNLSCHKPELLAGAGMAQLIHYILKPSCCSVTTLYCTTVKLLPPRSLPRACRCCAASAQALLLCLALWVLLGARPAPSCAIQPSCSTFQTQSQAAKETGCCRGGICHHQPLPFHQGLRLSAFLHSFPYFHSREKSCRGQPTQPNPVSCAQRWLRK